MQRRDDQGGDRHGDSGAGQGKRRCRAQRCRSRGTVTSDSAAAPAGPAATPITTDHRHARHGPRVERAERRTTRAPPLPSRSGGTRQTVVVDYGLEHDAPAACPGRRHTRSPRHRRHRGRSTARDCSGRVALRSATRPRRRKSRTRIGKPNRTERRTCTITGSGTHYTVKVSGLDYSLQHVPTIDSLGNPISSTTNFVASGALTFSYTTGRSREHRREVRGDADPVHVHRRRDPARDERGNDSGDTTIVMPGAFAINGPVGPASGRAALGRPVLRSLRAPLMASPFPGPRAGTSTNPGPSRATPISPRRAVTDNVTWSNYRGAGGADLAGSCTMSPTRRTSCTRRYAASTK